MTTRCKPLEIQTNEEWKKQTDQYWNIIEKQRIIIQTLQKSLTKITSENEYLIKKNRELENCAPVVAPVSDSVGVTHPIAPETSPSPFIETVNATPVPPPRSPYRVHHGTSHHPTDVVNNIKSNQIHSIIPDIPKRPPFLNLKKSNHHSPLYSRSIKDTNNTAELLNKEYLISPGKTTSNPSSPLSIASAGTPSLDNRPSFESSDHSYSSKYSTHQSSSLSPKHSPTTLHEQDRPSSYKRRESANRYEKNIPDLDIISSSKSEPSTPIKPRTPRFDSLMTRNEYNGSPTTLSSLSNIQIQVISSSIATDEKKKDYQVFVIGIKDDLGDEVWRIKKTFVDILNLDTKLKITNANLKRLPDKSLFTAYSPVKMEEKKALIEDYLQHAMTSKSNNQITQLCDFLSSDRILHTSKEVGIKQGYLTKRGKNFGGWKTRYFVVDNTGVLKYFESKDGNFLGTIKLFNSQIRSQTAQEDYESSYRHAFLILELKSNGSHHRHIFCANSDEDRTSWVNSLCYYSNQIHMTHDAMDSSISEDSMFVVDQLILEPSSSTESARTAPTISKRPSMDGIYNYFSQHNQTEVQQRRSSTKDISSLKEDVNSNKELEDSTSKKSKHRISRKAFWGKKMFGSNSGSSNSEVASPTSPHSSSYDSMYFSAMNDYEETRGKSQVFGIPLENAVSVARVYDQYELPAIIHRCIEYVETKNGLNEEGIYRLSGSSAFVKQLKKRFNDEGDVKLLEDKEYHDVHAIAGLLKMWLRELPENIFTEALLGDFLKSNESADRQTRVSEVGKLVSFLPLVNYTLLRSLCAHLIRVIEHSEENKMTLRNISIVFSATLGIPSSIFNLLLVDFDYIFWTNRCTDNQTVPTTEDAIKCYMQDVTDEEVENITSSYRLSVPPNEEVGTRSNRNSILYQSSTPKDFILLEEQLHAVIDDIPTPYDDEPYCSDEELEMAYFASRYTANSKSPITSTH